eukprot:366472-Chlamydomonas_euryale.AAC.20
MAGSVSAPPGASLDRGTAARAGEAPPPPQRSAPDAAALVNLIEHRLRCLTICLSNKRIAAWRSRRPLRRLSLAS